MEDKDLEEINEEVEEDDSEELDNTSEEIEENDLEKEIDKLKEEKDEILDQLMRLQADFVNFRKRSEKEKQATISFAVEGFVLDLLPVLDNFERALNSEDDKENPFYKGVELIFNELNRLLENNNVVEIEAIGEDFDPSMHHAVVMEESDEFEEGKVIDVLQTGYMIKDKVIRPCMVKVSK